MPGLMNIHASPHCYFALRQQRTAVVVSRACRGGTQHLQLVHSDTELTKMRMNTNCINSKTLKGHVTSPGSLQPHISMAALTQATSVEQLKSHCAAGSELPAHGAAGSSCRMLKLTTS